MATGASASQQAGRQAGRQAGWQAGRRAGRQAGKQAGGQALTRNRGASHFASWASSAREAAASSVAA